MKLHCSCYCTAGLMAVRLPEHWIYLLLFQVFFKKSIKVTQSPIVPTQILYHQMENPTRLYGEFEIFVAFIPALWHYSKYLIC
jgi:hypothetical protein